MPVHASPATTIAPRHALLVAALIIAAGLLAYWHSFRGVFLLDDLHDIVENTAVHQFWPPWRCLFASHNISRPVVALTFAANWALGGDRLWGFHAVNLVVHLSAALVLFGIVRRTLLTDRLRDRFGQASIPVALAVSLLWLSHPLQTQAVTYIIQRYESLMGLCFLVTLYAVIRGFGSPRQRSWHAAAIASCFLGMGCKQVMVAAPLVVLHYDAVFLSGSFRAALKRRTLYAGLAAAWIFLAVLLRAAPKLSFAGFHMASVTPWQYAVSQPGVIFHYLRLAVWPDVLCFDYAWPLARTAGEMLVPGFGMAILLGASVWALRRAPALGFLGAAFFLILAPSSSIMPVADLAFEHRMYLPLAALLSGIVVGVYLLGCGVLKHRWLAGPQRSRMAWIAGATLVAIPAVALGYRTSLRNLDYGSAEAMWTLVAAQRPSNARAVCIVGTLQKDAGKTREALASYRAAVKINPDYYLAQSSLGALLAGDNNAEALEHAQAGVRLMPEDAVTHTSLGMALAALGRTDAAIDEYRAALQLEPDDTHAHNDLGAALGQQGKWAEAIDQYRTVLRIDPRYVEAYTNLGLALVAQGDLAGALNAYDDALRIKPDGLVPHNLRGIALALQGHLDESLGEIEIVIRADPNNAEAHNNYGLVLAAKGRFEEAASHYRASIRLMPERAKAHVNLGNVLAAQGQTAAAEAEFRTGLRLEPGDQEARAWLDKHGGGAPASRP